MVGIRSPSEEDIDRAVGLNIKARRQSLGLSQQALAEAAGVTFQQIQKYERGTNRVSGSRLVQIARSLDCSLTQLCAGLGLRDGDDGEDADYGALARDFFASPYGVPLARAFVALRADDQRVLLAAARAFSTTRSQR